MGEEFRVVGDDFRIGKRFDFRLPASLSAASRVAEKCRDEGHRNVRIEKRTVGPWKKVVLSREKEIYPKREPRPTSKQAAVLRAMRYHAPYRPVRPSEIFRWASEGYPFSDGLPTTTSAIRSCLERMCERGWMKRFHNNGPATYELTSRAPLLTPP